LGQLQKPLLRRRGGFPTCYDALPATLISLRNRVRSGTLDGWKFLTETPGMPGSYVGVGQNSRGNSYNGKQRKITFSKEPDNHPQQDYVRDPYHSRIG
jgi:hypothetical protein